MADERLIMRQQNDLWLRTKSVNSQGRIVDASRRRIAKRQASGAFRMCRCGQEIESRGRGARAWTPPEVYMCLGCEGVTHVGPYVNTGANPGGVRESITRTGDPLTVTSYRLRRH